MAQTQFWTDEGIGEVMKLVHGTEATKLAKIAGMTDTEACTAAVGNTYSSPADAMCTQHGLETAAITTVALATANTTGDAIDFDHVFTASDTINVSGIMVMNNEATPDVLFISCCFNAVLAMENTDTLTIDGRGTLDQAA